MVLVSIIIPVRDHERRLAATLESVLAQTQADWECLIVDDGSTDGTASIIERYAACDRRFRVKRTAGVGSAAARNRGLRAARGRYVAPLDSDDIFPPDRLEWQVEVLEGNRDLVLVYGETSIFDPAAKLEHIYLEHEERPQGPYAFESLLATSAIHAPLVRRRALRKVGGFDVDLPSAEDWDAWLAVSKLGGIAHRCQIALRHRVRAGTEPDDLPRHLRCARRVLEKHLPDVPAERRARVRRAAEAGFRARYGPSLLEAAQAATRAGAWQEARPLWRALARLDPNLLRARSVLLHTLWSCLPTREAPEWRDWLHGADEEGFGRG